ncbi:SPFH domain-containing protein [Agrobacterium salinitolerans]
MSSSITDKPAFTHNGYMAIAAIAFAVATAIAAFLYQLSEWKSLDEFSFIPFLITILLIAFGVFIGFGIFLIQPNESAVLILFGKYKGTDKTTGLRWTNPFFSIKRVSRRLQTHNIESIKVNDAAGNPIEIGAAVVWHVDDSAKALLEVDDFKIFVAMQAETALRKIASHHPYDNWLGGEEAPEAERIISLRDGGEDVAMNLISELRNRCTTAGIQVTDARITHLAYAPEIASAMLRRQQAAAVVSARRTIVKGAVELVKEALMGLKDKNIEIDHERQAAMVSNMLVVLVGDKDVTPVINTGTLYG